MPGVFLQREQDVDGQARSRGPVELARLRLRRLHQVGERVDLQRGADGDAEEVVDDRRDRDELRGIVGQPLVQQVIERDDAGEREQKGVVVARREQGASPQGCRRRLAGSPPRPAGPSARPAARPTSRAERSMPLPGGSGTISRTVFCGQLRGCVCACAGITPSASIDQAEMRRVCSSGEANGHAADRSRPRRRWRSRRARW